MVLRAASSGRAGEVGGGCVVCRDVRAVVGVVVPFWSGCSDGPWVVAARDLVMASEGAGEAPLSGIVVES